MRVLALGNLLNTPRIRQAAAEAAWDTTFLSMRQFRRERPTQQFDVLLASSDHGDHLPLTNDPLLQQCTLVVPLSGEQIAAGISPLSAEDIETLNAYFAYGGTANLRNGFARIQQLLHGTPKPLAPPQTLPLDAIYTFDDQFFDCAGAFLAAQKPRFPCYIGMVSYRSRWAEGDIAVEKAITTQLARRGIGVIAVYTDGSPNAQLGTLSFEDAVQKFFCCDGKPVIDLLLNFQFFATKAGNGQDMFAQAADCYAALDIPVIRPVGLGHSTQQQWLAAKQPYAADLSTNFIVPERQGMLEPVHVSCADDFHCRQPIPERMERLTGRIAQWITLRRKPNRDKRIAVMLHNAPCSGVEATVGMATDLDAFQSAINILRRLREEGYTVSDFPEDGQALQQLILNRKAISDFRWTSAEDIAYSGGVLYTMETAEYARYYARLSETAREQMESSWGAPPGQAMVLNGTLLITGISFGNVLLMVQPKRGCYGAKCTGEVCKILQDPSCPPSHQFLATYWYLAYHWRADAVIHLGTHGSLEYLPGKSCGLSADCFPDLALGHLINLYPYNASVVSQALIARRRSYAVTLSYLPAPGKGLDADQRRMVELIQQYFAAKEQQNGQDEWIRETLLSLTQRSLAAQSVFARESDFDRALTELRSLLLQTQASRRGTAHRALGAAPDRQWIRDYITELWESEADTLPGKTRRERAADALHIAHDLRRATAELDALLHALSGGFLHPSQGGDASYAGRAILPTGRNLHGNAQDKLPTPAAYERGTRAAENLLAHYREETGALPEKIAMNMTSLDVTRTGGEQLGQFLSLLGIRPIWQASGRVEGLACIPLRELGRPRIDVTVHISSVMRDAWPDILTWMDRAIRLAAEQDESDEDNFVRANSRRITNSGEDGTGRIFGGQPGTYTSAVGLALKASAWKSEEDLAKYFIDSSSYLYGEHQQGVHAPNAFAANVRQIDLTCDITASRRTDAVASSYSARVQGGFRLAARALGSQKQIRQYMGERHGDTRIVSLSDHVARAIQETLLNDIWREQTMAQGYQGAAQLMCRMQNIFDTQCVCEAIAPAALDAIVQQYLLDDTMQRWFREHNPHALEEVSRRFLEMNTRGKWNGDSEVLQKLRRAYLQAEGELEDNLSGCGEIQAGSVDIVAHDQVEHWAERLAETERILAKWQTSNP